MPLIQLVKALDANLPFLVLIGVQRSSEIVPDLEELTSSIASLGADATGCAAAQVSALASVSASLRLSVAASASVSEKAGAGG
jgi:hypothetical protein